MLVVGGLLVAAAALLAGTSGFGFGLIATPLLLLSGFSLPFVVTVNLLVSVATRISVAVRLRRSVDPVRAALLVAGCVPGLYAGARILGAVDARTLELGAGIVVMAAAAALMYAERHPPRGPGRAAPLAGGFLGGVLGTTTSLIGVPPALLLARQRLAARSFFADVAIYFVAAGAIALAILALDGDFDGGGAKAFVYWLPRVLVANAIGTTVGLRVPERIFRVTTLGLSFAAGALTVASA